MEKDNKDNKDKDIRLDDLASYLREEAVSHIRHWKAVKREVDTLYGEMETETERLVSSSKDIVTGDVLVALMERNRKVQLLNLEAVKINARVSLIAQVAASYGIRIELDTTYSDKFRELVADKSTGFMFHEDGGRLAYNDPELEAMMTRVSEAEMKRIGIDRMYSSLVDQFKEFKDRKAEGLKGSVDKN